MKTWRDTLLDIVKDFISVRSFITLGAFSTLYIFVLSGKEVPQIIAHLIDILLGFWFGSKVASQIKQKEIV